MHESKPKANPAVFGALGGHTWGYHGHKSPLEKTGHASSNRDIRAPSAGSERGNFRRNGFLETKRRLWEERKLRQMFHGMEAA